jgi:probable H4MPT-linked C1 transfer pathway protein
VQRRRDERAAGARGRERVEVGGVAHAAAREQDDLRAPRAQRREQLDVRALARADPREVEDDGLVRPRGGQARERVRGAERGERGVGREGAPGAEVEADDERRVRERGAQAPERVDPGERLGADDHAGDPEVEERRDGGRVRRAGVEHHLRLAGERGDQLAVALAARDRVEVGDVELVEAEAVADGARDGHRVGARDQSAAERAVAFALPAHGVHGDSALEIDDRDHAHEPEGSRMRGVIGLDIGGANTKGLWRDGDERRTISRPFEVWREGEPLASVLRDVVAGLTAGEPPGLTAVTTTAELSDAFRTKAEGIAHVLDAVAAVVPGPVLVLTTAGELVGVGEARERPLDVAAANWVASAMAVAVVHPDALMLDVGSTTADVIPIAAGRVAAAGRTDLDRLLAGELVYTGLLRTNLAAIAPRVPVRGGWSPVASELFAVTADVHLILGHLGPEAYTCPTPDGRAASVEAARERVARLVCSDTDQLAPGEIDAIAAHLHAAQVSQIEAAARQVAPRVADGGAPVVTFGAGAFLARAAAARLGRPVAEMPWTAAERAAAPAAALAALAAARVRAAC